MQPDDGATPQLLAPQLAEPQTRAAMPWIAAAGVLAVGVFALHAAGNNKTTDVSASRLVPAVSSDLSEKLVTPVRSDDAQAVKSAVATLRLPQAQRDQIENDISAGRRRIGWLVLTDSIDPDGDAVAVESAGVVQQVVLTKAWVPVAVLLDETRIGITATRDGGGGGVTIAVATRGGSIPLRIMMPGEHIEVVP